MSILDNYEREQKRKRFNELQEILYNTEDYPQYDGIDIADMQNEYDELEELLI